MTIYLHPQRRPQQWTPEERLRFLSSVLESFSADVEQKELLRRIVTITLEHFGVDRAWLIHPVSEQAEIARVRYSVSTPSAPVVTENSIPLSGSRALIRRALESPLPIVVKEGDAELDRDLAARFGVRSEMVQILRPRDGEPWAFGIHMMSEVREWKDEEISLFAEVGRYATLALTNALFHDRAVSSMAKAIAILDQIPESAAIYDADGRLERMNAAATREPSQIFAPDPDGRLRGGHHRSIDGSPLSISDLPSMRALRGETVNAEYLIRDPRSNEDRVVNLKASPIRDARGRIIGSVVLSRDVSEERETAERETSRRRRAEALANLGLDPLVLQSNFENLDEPAQRIAKALSGTAGIFLYHPATGNLDLVGFAGTANTEKFGSYFAQHPYRPGEGLPGTTFQIGRPLFFYDIRGND
ncbi:MAG TPA: PAS domain-containing protein, partial [Thermoanaerobaculia bacterium]|nr:PAS domain-containing protein [Thermoanaerobaculia bacterium]